MVWKLCVDGGLVFGGCSLWEGLMAIDLSLDIHKYFILWMVQFPKKGSLLSYLRCVCKLRCLIGFLEQWRRKGLQSHYSVGIFHSIPLFQSNCSFLAHFKPNVSASRASLVLFLWKINPVISWQESGRRRGNQMSDSYYRDFQISPSHPTFFLSYHLSHPSWTALLFILPITTHFI